MMPGRMSARGLQAAVRWAIAGGKHRVEIAPDGRIIILPLAIPPQLADDAALDDEIRGLIEHDEGGSGGHSRRPI